VSALAGGIAVASAICFAGSTSLQHQAAQDAPSAVHGSVALVLHLLRRPLWLVGQVLAIVGLVLHAAALHIGSIAVVQPIVISGVVLAVPVRSALGGRWPWPREIVAVLFAAVGLTVFLVAANPAGGSDAPRQVPALLICLVGVALAAAAGLSARLVVSPTRSAFLLGTAAGVLFGLVAGLMKSFLYDATHGDVLHLLTSWTTWALAVLGVVAVVTNQHSYRFARLSASMPVLNVVDGVVALVFGVVAFHEVLRHSPFFLTVQVLGFAAIAVGLIIVSLLEEHDTSAEESAGRVEDRMGY
jgi:drug/metabolite transporter (DMT)-like permease